MRDALVRLRALLVREWRFMYSVGLVIGIFVFLSLQTIGAPALYMDGINPDYEVVKVLHPQSAVTVWEAPGDFMFGRFPAMFGLYAGSFSVYWALPFYLLLGGSLLGVRLAHLCVGVLILGCFALLCRSLTRSAIVASIAALALAVDPTFIYVFRANAYVVQFPIFFVLLALFAVYRFPNPRGYFFGGLAIGLAASGYFVYLLTIPGIVLFAFRDSRLIAKQRGVATLALGICAGVVPYVIGYGLLFHELGLQGGVAWLQGALGGLHVASSDGSYVGRIQATGLLSTLVMTNDWLWMTFWGSPHPDWTGSFKATLLLLVPFFALLSLASGLGDVRRALALALFVPLSFLGCATYFGSRFGGHDLICITVLAYVLAAASAAVLLESLRSYGFAVKLGLVACAATALVANLTGTAAIANKLASQHASGLYSNIISDFPQQVLAAHETGVPYIFWSWGEMLPFIYETGGAIPAFGRDQLASSVCRYGVAKVVLLGGDAIFPDSAGTFPHSGLTVLSTQVLHDDHSGFPLKVVTVKAARQDASCSSQTAIVTSLPDANGFASSAQPAKATKVLKLTTSAAARGVSFIAAPNPVAQGSADLPIVSVKWLVPTASKIEIHMGTQDGQLFTIGGNAGSATTGPWVQDGVRFYLQDVSDGPPGKTAAVLTVSNCKSCKPAAP